MAGVFFFPSYVVCHGPGNLAVCLLTLMSCHDLHRSGSQKLHVWLAFVIIPIHFVQVANRVLEVEA